MYFYAKGVHSNASGPVRTGTAGAAAEKSSDLRKFRLHFSGPSDKMSHAMGRLWYHSTAGHMGNQ